MCACVLTNTTRELKGEKERMSTYFFIFSSFRWQICWALCENTYFDELVLAGVKFNTSPINLPKPHFMEMGKMAMAIWLESLDFVVYFRCTHLRIYTLRLLFIFARWHVRTRISTFSSVSLSFSLFRFICHSFDDILCEYWWIEIFMNILCPLLLNVLLPTYFSHEWNTLDFNCIYLHTATYVSFPFHSFSSLSMCVQCAMACHREKILSRRQIFMATIHHRHQRLRRRQHRHQYQR